MGLGTCSAQPYANSWLTYSQKYLEFKITGEGIYRIDSATLSNALQSLNPPVQLSSIDPRNIQLFGRGEQQYIYIEGENDSTFDSADFIEFYATKNDGWLDAQIYDTPASQSNPYYSLFNDTATYYLTWNDSLTNNRMAISNSTNFSLYTASLYFFKEVDSSYAYKFYHGKYYQGEVVNPLYVEGKGWFSNVISSLSVSLNTSFADTQPGAPDATVNIVAAGVNGNNHILQISYGSSNIILTTDTFAGYPLRKYPFTIQPANLGNPNTLFTFQSLSPGPGPDYTAVSHIFLRYSHTYNLGGVAKMMMILPPDSDTTFINATSYPANTPYIYDLTSHFRIATSQGATLKALVPQANTERKVYLIASNQIQNITSLTPVTPNGKFTDFGAMLPDSPFVIISHQLLWDGATQYANYRNHPVGRAVLADIDELYDQFAYGINKHPLAIRNFCKYILNAWAASPPQHLFLIGKGISESDFNMRSVVSLYAQNLIPAYGWPASDIAFTAGLNVSSSPLVPAIPTGRLAAKTEDEVKNYLNKVTLFENNLAETPYPLQQTIPNKIWMKEILHFAGGNLGTENDLFNIFLKEYADTIKKELYGGNVHTFSKNTTQSIQVNLTDSIRMLIDSGVSIMTFFGHSSSGASDISIGSASEYNNYGKYPLIIANGCFSGDVFTTTSLSTSEDFVLATNRGAIGYIANTNLGFREDLHEYTKNLYTHIGKKSYGKSIGKCMQQTIKDDILTSPSDTFSTLETVLGMTLHGDPALLINTHVLPDYAIAPEYVYFTPENVTSDNNTFILNVIIANLGRADTDSVSIYVKRSFPNGTVTEYLNRIPHVFYVDTFHLTLPVDLANGIGLNQFYIHVDQNYIIPEISESNNEINYPPIELFIQSSDLIPVYPYNYAVVPNKSIVLKASTSDPFAPPRNYVFEIDTNDAYSSSKFKQDSVTSAGGVVKWNIDTNYFDLGTKTDSTAFFWRVSPDTIPRKWREHSFEIISGKSGWGQKHFFQFKNDKYVNIRYNKPDRVFEFFQQVKGLQCNVWGNPQNNQQLDQTGYLIDDVTQDYNTATGSQPAMYIAIIDKCSLMPWGTRKYVNSVLQNPDHDFGQANGINPPPGRLNQVEYYFVFLINNPAQMDSLQNLLNNKIPAGNYVLAYCFENGMFTDNLIWTPSRIQAFQNLGAVSMPSVPDSVPYIFFGQKGYSNPDSAKEVIGDSAHAFIQLSDTMYGCTGSGTITTETIGPSYKWGSLHWEFQSNNSAGDRVKMDVLDDASDTVIKSFITYSGDIIPLDSLVKAKQHPYIKLRANIEDSLLFTCAQLARWHVLYDEIPEAALNPFYSLHPYNFHAASLQQGDSLKFSVAIENVSNADMDSLRIKYWIEDAQRNAVSVIYKKNAPLLRGEVMYDNISFSTRNISGNCIFWLEVNPLDTLWQLEQYHFNNIAHLAFVAQKDNTNPLLDVTFDGIHILNKDIVSPKPAVVIQLKDENKYLALDDPAKFKITVIDPDNNSRNLNLVQNGTQDAKFSKAVLPDNKCKIEWNPAFAKDGIYELRVQGSDVTGNKAGDLNYSIKFEVINKSSITEILNYPNPFSSSTRFVFTLTGAEIPDYMRIQILTVSGKVVREITGNELGIIRIGRNITDFAWNGTDEFGDPLANGVYLYHVIAKINGENIEHRNTNADSFFKKGFGKMYLMR